MNEELQKELIANGGLEWVTNIKATFDVSSVSRRDGQSLADAIKEYWEWRSQLVVGDPHPTRVYTTDALQRMGLVGLYRRTES